MKYINAKNIFPIPEERVVTPEEMAKMKDYSHDLSKLFLHSPEKTTSQKEEHKDITKYFISFPPKNKIRNHIPDLEAALESMKINKEQQNEAWLMKDIDYIVENYKDQLLLNEVLEIYLLLARKLLDDDDFSSITQLLAKLQHHEKDLNPEQHKWLLYFLWLLCFKKAFIQNDDKALYAESIAYFNKILWPQLDEDMYMTILYRKSFALSSIGKYRASLSVIKEFLALSEEYEEDDEDMKKQRMEALLLKGDMHTRLGENKEAIESFRNYLLYNPYNDEVRKNIEYLQSEQSE